MTGLAVASESEQMAMCRILVIMGNTVSCVSCNGLHVFKIYGTLYKKYYGSINGEP